MAVWRRSSSIAKADQLCLSRLELPVCAQARPSLSSGRFVDAMWGGRKFDGFWTAEFSGKWLICIPGNDLYGRKWRVGPDRRCVPSDFGAPQKVDTARE